MRLIDVDKLIESLNNSGIEFNANINKIIIEQPTAYDVEKVCEELDWAIYPHLLFDVDNCELTETLLKADMVESIVRRGGVDE